MNQLCFKVPYMIGIATDALIFCKNNSKFRKFSCRNFASRLSCRVNFRCLGRYFCVNELLLKFSSLSEFDGKNLLDFYLYLPHRKIFLPHTIGLY